MNTDRNKPKLYLFLVMISTLLVVSVGGYFIVMGYLNQSSVKTVNSISSNEYYLLRSNATDYQKEIYKELTTALEQKPQDEKQVAQLIAKNYVADFYTWTNKINTQDVGGVQFLHNEIRKPVRDQALETFYNDMNYYLEKGLISSSLEVSDSTASVTKRKYQVDKETDAEAFVVDIKWNYKESPSLNISKYQKEAQVYVVKDEQGIYSIVEVRYEKNSQNTQA